MWEEINRISLLAASERAFMTPMPLMGDWIRALGSLATPWYLTVGDSGELAAQPGLEGDLSVVGLGDGGPVHHVDECLP